MFEYLRRTLLQDKKQNAIPEPVEKREENQHKKLQVATAALFIEMAKADGNFSDEERERVIHIMQNTFNLDEDCVHELIELSEKKLEESISVYEFTSIVNNHFSRDEKLELLEDLWKIVYVDDKLDKYEDRLVKVIGGLINVDHKDIINAKLLVKENLKRG
ncbi:MAG: hypothetical protein DRQ01_02775 [Ignavibacteriae bacterium]|nr:MAG: hypothetical protein DRQ01_02775 [Ignavibacteriota bacterium]